MKEKAIYNSYTQLKYSNTYCAAVFISQRKELCRIDRLFMLTV